MKVVRAKVPNSCHAPISYEPKQYAPSNVKDGPDTSRTKKTTSAVSWSTFADNSTHLLNANLNITNETVSLATKVKPSPKMNPANATKRPVDIKSPTDTKSTADINPSAVVMPLIDLGPNSVHSPITDANFTDANTTDALGTVSLCVVRWRNKTPSPQEVEAVLRNISAYLRVDRRNTSLSRRKRESIPDDRVSSVCLAVSSCSFLVMVLGMVILNDAISFFAFLNLKFEGAKLERQYNCRGYTSKAKESRVATMQYE
ncbi:hypothetical protein ElyMa_002452600 [Elysia marginata]|uniref:Uncharacterized protein n=1 Tax=Elysia marginata TaxID=1093978 RepID=A0AAV4GJJ5_9GAST|nr:hypothetical protein ElyMa_002452600 [Elysia marginata]